MSHIIADLQLHSKYSRAVSKEMVFPQMEAWAIRKGMELLATGDWTHPLWMKEIEEHLIEEGNGLLRLKQSKDPKMHFLLATEVSSIYSQNGRVRRVHTLIWVPTIAAAKKINAQLTKQGCNLMSDGRPIIGLTSIQVADLVLSLEPTALIIPAHAWTPWFSVYGALGGFDSLEEAFGKFSPQIFAVETGLSSNPSMNWRIPELDSRSILSFSDAHSGPKLGREATVFALAGKDLSYLTIVDAIKNVQSDQKRPHIAYTLEFFPEEGKYHYTGHRACNVRYTPQETKAKGTQCPVCGKGLTIGVMERIEALAGRSEESLGLESFAYELGDRQQIQMIRSKTYLNRPPFAMAVPLLEVISQCIGSPVTSKKTYAVYEKLLAELTSEFAILLNQPVGAIAKVAGERIAVGIEKIRKGDVFIDPGYDGVFGVVKLWKDGETPPLVDTTREQLPLV